MAGDTALIGARFDDDADFISGSAYVFELSISAIESTAALIEAVLALNLQSGITNSLDAKLDAVIGALDDLILNNDIAAINALQAFINAVEAQLSRGALTAADAEALIDAAQAIIVLLSS